MQCQNQIHEKLNSKDLAFDFVCLANLFSPVATKTKSKKKKNQNLLFALGLSPTIYFGRKKEVSKSSHHKTQKENDESATKTEKKSEANDCVAFLPQHQLLCCDVI